MPVFLDTNILVYSISLTEADREKRRRAEALIAEQTCVVSIQTLQEFYVQATRPGKTHRLTHEDAAAIVTLWLRFPVVENTAALLRSALDLKGSVNFSIWDCLIIAAARAGGCDTLYTEDMQDGRTIEGVKIVNPFA
ncbi:MAG: PIN domain-containing protein [Parvularculaceae bacterium]